MDDRTEFVIQAKAPGSRKWSDVEKHSNETSAATMYEVYSKRNTRYESFRLIRRYVQETVIKD